MTGVAGASGVAGVALVIAVAAAAVPARAAEPGPSDAPRDPANVAPAAAAAPGPAGVPAAAGARVPGAAAAAGTAGPASGAVADPTAAPPITATARASADAVTLGDSFHLFVTVVHPTGTAVNLPATLDLGAAFAERSRTATSTIGADGSVTRTFDLEVAAFDVGEFEIPAISVTHLVGGRARAVSTQPVPIRVDSFVGDGAEELRPIAGPVEVRRPDWGLALAVGGAAGVMAAVAVGVAVARRVKRRSRDLAVGGPGFVQRPPYEEAMARLAELEASGALDADDRKPAYVGTSEIIRGYLGRRFGFPALDLTTTEIRAELERRVETRELAPEINALLESCDLIKFANFDASPDEARTALYAARKLVQRTRSQPEAAHSPAADVDDGDHPDDDAAAGDDGGDGDAAAETR
jgi:hypothetical protein